MNAPTRPVMRYHGGKWRLAPWIISHFLMRKQRSFAEVYNDLDEDIVNVFRVLRDPEKAERLRELTYLTPWSRLEFYGAYESTDDPIERARRTIVRGFMAHGSTSRKKNRTGFRAKNYRRNQTGARDWCNWPDAIPSFVERLRGVTIECKPAEDVIVQQDTPETLFYLDPPYPIGTRTSVRDNGGSDADRGYRFNLTDEEHRALAEVLHGLDGMVVLSGYGCHLFDDELYADWTRLERETHADGTGPRSEVLWISPGAERLSLFQRRELFT